MTDRSTRARRLRHHAFGIEAEAAQGIKAAQTWIRKELGIEVQGNPDIVILRYGLFSVADARSVLTLAAGASFSGESKALIIAASRASHEAQNALLKLFEEPPPGTYLFFILPSLGGILPTLRSRVQILNASLDIGCPRSERGHPMSPIPEAAEEFMKASKEKRSAMIKKITSHQEGDIVSAREEAVALINGVEVATYMSGRLTSRHGELLTDIAILRGYLHERSAPVRMILEHLSLIMPKDLL